MKTHPPDIRLSHRRRLDVTAASWALCVISIVGYLGTGPVRRRSWSRFPTQYSLAAFFAGAFNMAFVPMFSKLQRSTDAADAKDFAQDALRLVHLSP
jgi:peptidoglycan biosynthesis protein MviN/MurJ (putative lipid II flippase)